MHLRGGNVHHADLATRLHSGEHAGHAKREHLACRKEPDRIAFACLELCGRSGRKPERARVEESRDVPRAGLRGVDHEGGLQAHRSQRVDTENAQHLLPVGERGFNLQDRTRRRDFRARRDACEDRVVEAAPRPADLDVGLAGESVRRAVDLRERRGVHRMHGAGERYAERDGDEREHKA